MSWVLVALFASWPKAEAAAPPTLPGFDLLGGGPCDGDDLYRPMSAMKAAISTTGGMAAIAPKCADLCQKAAAALDRCMGIQVQSDGSCLLYDRDWASGQRPAAEAALGVTLDARQLQDQFPGQHLVRVVSDMALLAMLTSDAACYRRQEVCVASPNCTALARHPCERGKVANTCDACLPRRQDAGGERMRPGNSTCMLVVNRSRPTLRIALGAPSFVMDDLGNRFNGNRDALNTVYLTQAFALMKLAWQDRSKILPMAVEDFEDFDTELYGFAENITATRTLSVNGTEEVGPASIKYITGVVASGVGDLGSTPQIRKLPVGLRPHVVIGTSNLDAAASRTAEASLARFCTEFQVPMLGWAFAGAELLHAPLQSFYVRTLKVALIPGAAIGKLLKTIGYTRATLVVQPAESSLESQVRQAAPAMLLQVQRPLEPARGPCSGQRGCTQEILAMWGRVRLQDARIIIHEYGGAGFEFLLAAQNDLLGERTLYIQTGFSCTHFDLYSILWTATYEYQAMTTLNITGCELCNNPSAQQILPPHRDNTTVVAQFNFGSRNPAAAVLPKRCPQFSNMSAMASCSYCKPQTLSPFFSTRGCLDYVLALKSKMAGSFCVDGDPSTGGTYFTAVRAWPACLRDTCSQPPGLPGTGTYNFTEDSARVVARYLAAGFPPSYLADFVPGGRWYEAGLASKLQMPVTLRSLYSDTQLMNTMLMRSVLESAWPLNVFLDALLTALVAFNNYVRLGGDLDSASSASALSTNHIRGNPVAIGWLKAILSSDFHGATAQVQYISSGERRSLYRVSQLAFPNIEGCFLWAKTNNSNPGAENNSKAALARFASSSGSLGSLPDLEIPEAELAISPKGNENLCEPVTDGAIRGKVVMARRGLCVFIVKLKAAHQAGALAVVVVDTVADAFNWVSIGEPGVPIPMVSVGRTEGLRVWDQVAAGTRLNLTAWRSRCIDPVWLGESWAPYGVSLWFDMGDESLRTTDSRKLTCTGTPGSPTAGCRGLLFNGAKTSPPRQEAEECPDGSEFSRGSRQCELCAEGRYSQGSLTNGRCVPCGSGYAALGPGSTQCGRCGRGSYAEVGAALCRPCPPGAYTDSDAAPSCTPCAPGRSAGSTGTNFSCSPCGQGTYAEQRGASACDSCPPSLTTVFPGAPGASDCTCLEGSFLSRSSPDGNGECAACPKWLACAAGLGAPLQAAGYAAAGAADGALPSSVVRCQNEVRCPGGTALGSCPEHREGLGCDLCAAGFFEGTDGACLSCDETPGALPVVLCLAAAAIAAVALYVRGSQRHSIERKSAISVVLGASVTVQMVQAIATFSTLKTQWTGVMASLHGFFTMMTLRLDSLKPGCAFNTNAAEVRYYTMLVVYPIFAAMLFALFALNVLRRTITWSRVWDTQGVAYSVFFLSVTVGVLGPWRCVSNPDSTQSMESERSIRCWESQGHRAMVALSVPGILLYVVSFLALVVWATVSYPQRVVKTSSSNFVESFRFLFERFQPSKYRFVIPYTLRLLGVALLPVFLSDTRQLQLLFMMLLFVCFGFLTANDWPWRTDTVNRVDLGSCGLLVMMLGTGCMLVDPDERVTTERILSGFLNAILGIVFGFTALALGHNAYLTIRPRRGYGVFLCHDGATGVAMARWIQVLMAQWTPDDIFVHADHVQELHRLADIVAFRSRNLVVLLTRQTLPNVSCACEIASAVRHGVNLVLAVTEDYEPPADAFIEGVATLWNSAERTQLAAAGVDVACVQHAYRAVKAMPVVRLAGTSSQQANEGVVADVLDRCVGLRRCPESGPAPQEQADVAIVVAGDDLEVRCAAQVLQRLLQREAKRPIMVVSDECAVDAIASKGHVLVLLTRDALRMPAFAAAVAAAQASPRATIMPILADAKFTFPGARFWETLRAGRVLAMEDSALRGTSLHNVVAAYEELLATPALRFTEHGPAWVQKAEVAAIAAGLADEACIGKRPSLRRSRTSGPEAASSGPFPRPLERDVGLGVLAGGVACSC